MIAQTSAPHVFGSRSDRGQTYGLVPPSPGSGKLFETLAKEGVNIEMISTSEIKISVVIDLARGEAAMKAVHAAFIG